MDLYARKIIARTLADTMEVSTVIETINKAKACRNTDLPLIIHSDRGSQYISNAWREATEKMQQSYLLKRYSSKVRDEDEPIIYVVRLCIMAKMQSEWKKWVILFSVIVP